MIVETLPRLRISSSLISPRWLKLEGIESRDLKRNGNLVDYAVKA